MSTGGNPCPCCGCPGTIIKVMDDDRRIRFEVLARLARSHPEEFKALCKSIQAPAGAGG